MLRDFVGALDLHEQYVIGSLEGPREYAFGSIASVAPRADNGFYVCDAQDVQVRSYDSTGRFEREIGRRGSGPGEYTACRTMFVVGGELIVNDVGNARLVAFAHSTAHARTMRWQSPHQAVAAESDQRFWSWESRLGRTAGEQAWNVAVLYDASRTPLDSITLPSFRSNAKGESFVIATDDGNLSPAHDSVFAILPRGGAAIAPADRYRVELRGTPDSVRVLSRAINPLPYRQAERVEWDAFSDFYDRLMRRRTLRVLDRKPLIRDLRGDDVGRVWVRLADTSYRRESAVPPGSLRPRLTHGEQGVWDIFDGHEGDYIGQVRVPLGCAVAATEGDRVWLRCLAADGYLQIAVHRLVPGGSVKP